MKLIAGALITAVLLAVVPANSSAASKYYQNTYREGYAFTVETILQVWDGYEHIYSTSTGKIISSKLAKYCKIVLSVSILDDQSVKKLKDDLIKILRNG